MTREHLVYWCYDANGALLYVGCTKDIATRERHHRRMSPWFSQAMRFRVAGPYERATAFRLEGHAIRSGAPVHNLFHAGRSASHQLIPADRVVKVNGSVLRDIRMRAGLRQHEVAAAAGIVQSYLCNIEAGRQHPSARVAAALAKALGVSVIQFAADVAA